FHCHTRMPMCMADQGNHRDFIRQCRQRTDAVEAVPGLAFSRLVDLPAITTVPLLRSKALTIKPGALLQRVIASALQHVNGGMRKIVQPAGMIEVEMREHDMAHIIGAKTHRFDLPRRGHFCAEVRRYQRKEEGAETRTRVCDITKAKTGVYKYK